MRWRPAPITAAAVCLAIGLVLSAGLARWQQGENTESAAARFEAATLRAGAQLQERLNTYEYGLRGARGAVIAAGPQRIDRTAYRRYALSRDIDREFPGARGIGLIRRVPVADEADFVRAEVQDGAPDFALRQIAPHEGERYVVQYIEPAERNRGAVGIDIASEAHRRTAAEQAMASGTATITAPLTLVRPSGQPTAGVLLLLPIYWPDPQPPTAREREATTFGWAFAPLVIEEVLAGLDFVDGELTLALTDRTGPQPKRFFASPRADEAAAGGLVAQLALPVYGRAWEAEMRATPAFVAQLKPPDPRVIAAVGAVASLLLAGVVLLFGQGGRRAQLMRAEQQRRAAMVDASNDAIIGMDLHGRVLDWNPAAERLFGYSAAEALGQSVATLILPEERAGEGELIRAAVAEGKPVLAFDTVRRALDGRRLEVSVTASPVRDPAGAVIGLSTHLRDISEARLTERKVSELNAALEDKVAERTARLEAALRDNQGLSRFLDRTGQLAQVGGWMVDLRTGVIEWTDQTCHIHNVPPGHRPTLDEALAYYPPEAREVVSQAVERGIATGQGWDLELPFVTATGRSLWVRAIGEVEFEEGQAVRLVGAFQDVSARRALESQLRQRNELMTTVLENVPCALSVYDADLKLVTWNQTYQRLLDFPAWLFEGETPRLEDFIRYNAERGEYGEGDRDALVQAIVERARQPAVHHRFERVRGDGTTLEVQGAPMPTGGFITMHTDITERRRAEQALKLRERLMQLVIDSFPGPMAHWDQDMRCTIANHAYRDWLGFDPEQMIGRTQQELFGPQIFARNELLIRAALGGEKQRVERSRVMYDGQTRHYLLHYVPDRDAEGVHGFISIVIDITELKHIQRQLEERTAQAEQANLAKSQFLANMSHEIRTPMNAVLGMSYLLGQTMLDTPQAELLGKISLAGKSLLGVINDILDLSKIEAGELAVERVVFSLPALLGELAGVMRPQVEAKRIVFRLDPAESLPDALWGDPMRLRQILTNLLSNAIKFTDRGGVELTVSPHGSGEALSLRFAVRDSGIGIAPEAQARLFTPFAQADASTTRRFGGSGLGLSIVKRLVDLMGGQVGVRSSAGAGSEFWVELPFQPASAAELPAPAARAPARGNGLRGVRVLVVDDSEINLEVARRILELEGAKVAVAVHGLQAFEILQAQPEAFDVVLMDVQMPVLDGHAATRRIRAELPLAALPIIALTAGALTSERQRAEVAGMDDFVSKPFDAVSLVACIRNHVVVNAVPFAARLDALGAAPDAAGRWPEIEGIDAPAVRSRLGDDLGMFRSMLRRLLAEFADLEADAAGLAAGTLDHHRGRMHKLRGGAGTLGAVAIAQLAGEAEKAGEAGEVELTRHLTMQLAEALARLREAAAPVLAEPPPDAPDASNAPGSQAEVRPLDARALGELVGLLRQQSLAAIDLFEALSSPLKQQLGRETFDALHAQIENLQFDAAVRTLQDATLAA